MTKSSHFRLAAIDDDPHILEDFRVALGSPDEMTAAAKRAQDLERELFGLAPPSGADITFDLVLAEGGMAGIDAVRNAVAEGRQFSVIFLDARMPPGPHGLETAQIIRKMDASVFIVVVTAYSDTDPTAFGRAAPPEDRIYFLTKPFHVTEVRQFARALSLRWEADQLSASADMVRGLGAKAIHICFDTLSRREQEVFRHVVDGLGNKEMGQLLQISPRTVESYRAKVMEKMRANSLPELVRMAIAAGLV